MIFNTLFVLIFGVIFGIMVMSTLNMDITTKDLVTYILIGICFAFNLRLLDEKENKRDR